MTKIKILLAQTETEIVTMITAIAKREEFELSIAADGKDAIQMIEREKFDLVICDLTLPGATGSEAACRMRLSNLNADSSFTLLTGDQNPKLIGELFGLDKIDSYIPKPASFSQISAHIYMMVNMKRRRYAVIKNIALTTGS